MLKPALFLAFLSLSAYAQQQGSDDPARLHSPLLCHMEREQHLERITLINEKRPMLFVTLEFLCGYETPARLSKQELRKAARDCRGTAVKVINESLGKLPIDEAAKKLRDLYASKGIKAPQDLKKLMAQGTEKLVEVLLDPNTKMDFKGQSKEEESFTMTMDGAWFSPLPKRFGLIPLNSEKGQKAERRWYREVELDGVRYLEPSYSEGEYHLGNPAHLAMAKRLFPDAVEVLANDHAVIGRPQGNGIIGHVEKSEIGERIVAVRLASGAVVPVLQILRAPSLKEGARADMAQIELTRQFIIPTNGEELVVDLTQLPEIGWSKEPANVTKSGTYVLRAHCEPQKLP